MEFYDFTVNFMEITVFEPFCAVLGTLVLKCLLTAALLRLPWSYATRTSAGTFAGLHKVTTMRYSGSLTSFFYDGPPLRYAV